MNNFSDAYAALQPISHNPHGHAERRGFTPQTPPPMQVHLLRDATSVLKDQKQLVQFCMVSASNNQAMFPSQRECQLL